MATRTRSKKTKALIEAHTYTPEPVSRDRWLESIALVHLGISTLERRGRDGLDFHDVGVVSLKAALEAAFRAGHDSALT